MARDADSDRPLVVIVDDDADVRMSIEELMRSVGTDVTSFGSTQDLLAARLPERPGCLVLDVRMPGASGLDLQQQLTASGNAKPIVFLTGHGDIPMSVQAMKAGAIDFLTKPFRDQSLLDAVAAGIDRDRAQREEARRIKHHADHYHALTARERQVLALVARGRLNKQIAFELGISAVTVKLHRAGVMKKMQVNSIGELIRAWELLPTEVREPRT